ncbi:MAG TPA: NAD(P)-dependent oxidoreductase [Steroidobacteraceae bacterium]|jgi:nucleoside-diphosphate-sugar epimerase
MAYRIFLAGASGAVGKRLIPLLREAGHQVIGTTRSHEKTALLRTLGAEPVVINVFDAAALARAVSATRPDIVIHQLTDLPKDLDPSQMADALIRNARIREEGTRNLVQAALATHVRRLIAQSISWAYATGHEPHVESDPLDTGAQGDRGITMRGVLSLESQVLHSPPLEGIVLRYGQLYGPATYSATPSKTSPVHVDAAAYAAFLAIDHGQPGAFNIAQPNSHVATDKARVELDWSPDFRLPEEDSAIDRAHVAR